MRKLVRDVKASASGDLSMDWLLPYMSKMTAKKDHVLCRKGDTADSLYYLQDGKVFLPEIDTYLGPGSLIGEIGLFMPDSTRTSTIICSEDCVLMTIPADKVYELYHQNPEFGFYMIRIVTDRLIQNVRRLEGATAVRGS
jgi:CRP-like cAMP-binding protein